MDWDSIFVGILVIIAAYCVGRSIYAARKGVCNGGCPSCSQGITGKCTEKNQADLLDVKKKQD